MNRHERQIMIDNQREQKRDMKERRFELATCLIERERHRLEEMGEEIICHDEQCSMAVDRAIRAAINRAVREYVGKIKAMTNEEMEQEVNSEEV